MAGQRGGEAGQKAERQQGGGSEWRVGLGQRAEGRRAGSDGREGHMGAEGRGQIIQMLVTLGGCIAPGEVPCQHNTRDALGKPSMQTPWRKIM